MLYFHKFRAHFLVLMVLAALITQFLTHWVLLCQKTQFFIIWINSEFNFTIDDGRTCNFWENSVLVLSHSHILHIGVKVCPIAFSTFKEYSFHDHLKNSISILYLVSFKRLFLNMPQETTNASLTNYNTKYIYRTCDMFRKLF